MIKNRHFFLFGESMQLPILIKSVTIEPKAQNDEKIFGIIGFS